MCGMNRAVPYRRPFYAALRGEAFALAQCRRTALLGAPFRQRSGGAVVNDMPVACQSRAVTEPQREKAPLEIRL